MPFGNVFEKINSEYYQLTSAEKKVADYAVIHQQKTQFMSISELAGGSPYRTGGDPAGRQH